jgi:hypothetical protein
MTGSSVNGRDADAAACDFFAAVRQRFDAAASSAGLIEKAFRIGDRTVGVRFAGSALESLIAPALAHLLIPDAPPDLTVFAFDTATTGIRPPSPGWDLEAYGVRGEIAGFNTDQIRTVYQPGSDILLMIDRERAEAIYWTADRRNVPYWECSFPLRTIFHWWLEDLPFQPVHAGAVGLPEGGVLIAGRSGSGKSTAALACLASQLRYAGDDYVLVRHDPVHVYSLYGTVKLEADNLARFPDLAPLVSNAGRLHEEKALIYLNAARPEKMLASFPVRALLVPQVTGRRDTVLRHATAGEAFRALAPTTLFHLPGAARQAVAKMSALVSRVPVYALEAGTDLAQIPAAILRLLETGART